jgi:LysR family transcriptional regulator, hydrogen peroxide-inducible genes activator
MEGDRGNRGNLSLIGFSWTSICFSYSHNPDEMEVYQLRYFTAVARAGSMVAAAAECHATQPTLSAQVKALEGELGVRLLDRHAWGVRLTPAGERVLATAKSVFDEIELLRSDIDERRLEQKSNLRIGIQPFIASEVLAEPLRALVAEMPEQRVISRERPNDLLLDLLLNRQVDVCFMSSLGRWPAGLEVHELVTLNYAAYCREDHPLARNTAASLRDLLPFPLLIYNGPVNTVHRLQGLARKLSVELHLAFMSDQASTAFTMATEGAGVAVLPRVFESRCKRARMREIALTDAGLAATVCAVLRREAETPKGASRLIELSREKTGNVRGA